MHHRTVVGQRSGRAGGTERIGVEIHRRIRAAVGPDSDPRTPAALEMTFFGALVNAGSGAFTYHQIADRLSYVVGLIVGEDR